MLTIDHQDDDDWKREEDEGQAPKEEIRSSFHPKKREKKSRKE